MTDPTGSDVLFGLKSIAKHLKLTPRQAQCLHQKGHIPTFKLGAIVCASKAGLAEHFAEQVAAAKEAAARG